MEHAPNNVLPCAHAYCQKCIKSFISFQECPKCPLCRYELSNNTQIDDTWEITEQPVRETISEYLANNKGCSYTSDSNLK